ncbi:SDR family NAD(P)-dependent oxidoreductase [uncultured Erythrobacter sp.]|uniref:SDR family NAD(P)-dependent oxidoreductase n=1 Tax=uncultured Erythrobacter sp. TaxID=263913 RepID=UPI00260E62B8|nr:SDR family NAD(P)-dependent oxidoreductase [uncultured Erythrobacter sp.]
MADRLSGKVAVVTGGSQNIGAAFSRRLADEGARVIIANRTRSSALRILEEIEAVGGEAHSVECDVSDPEAIERAAADIEARFGGIDILVNNAGIYLHNHLNDVTVEQWRTQADINLAGVLFFSKAAADQMKRKGRGRIINIGSAFGQDGFQGASIYAATKAGVAQMTKVLCLELRDFGITVNCIAPGWIATDMNAAMRADPEGEFSRRARERFGGDGVWMEPEELAGALVFLASDDAASVNGVVLPVDKGWAAY